MSSLRSHPVSRAALGILLIVALILTYRISLSQTTHAKSYVRMTDRSSINPIPKLEVTLKQTSASPATVQVSVTNKNDYAVTVLSYDSPLDVMALSLGLVTITPDGASKPLNLPKRQVRRVMPPPSDALIPIAPGRTVTSDIVLAGSGVEEALRSVSKVSVRISGNWQAVWAKRKGDIGEVKLGGVQPDPAVFSGGFSSEAVHVTVG